MRRGVAIAVAWALVALLFAGQAWFAAQVRGDPLAWTRAAGIWLAWAAGWTLLTPVALALHARHPIARPRWLAALAVHAVASVVLAMTNLALFALAAPIVGATQLEPTWSATFSRLLGTTFLLNLPVYWLVIGVAHLERLARTARETEARQARLEAQLADARLHALRTQLQPHFLFNALNSISVLMHEDPAAADRIVLQLSALLRRSLDDGDAQVVTLGEELAFVEQYLAIEQARFGDRLAFGIDVPAPLRLARVPSLVLQPLVENALRHGLAPRAGPGRLDITGERDGDLLRLRVEDDGVGLRRASGERVGLANTRARLELLYPGVHRFDVRGRVDGGVVAELELPWRTTA